VKRLITGLALLVMAAGLLAPPGIASPPPAALGAPAQVSRPSLPQIEREFMCPVCGVPLNVAESPQADRERAFIRDLYARGDSEAQIRRALVNEFGSAVLALPPHHGFDLSAYLVPLGAVSVLLAGLAVLLVRWRRRPASPGMGPAADPLTPSESRRLDEDLAHWRG